MPLTVPNKITTLSTEKKELLDILIPTRAIAVNIMVHIRIHVVITTYGPWSEVVMDPWGGKDPPLDEKVKVGGSWFEAIHIGRSAQGASVRDNLDTGL